MFLETDVRLCHSENEYEVSKQTRFSKYYDTHREKWKITNGVDESTTLSCFDKEEIASVLLTTVVEVFQWDGQISVDKGKKTAFLLFRV
ncbi:hypothetical protein NPIL_246351 [Nephila pilipes]|uniref:Uncharacterized protein n=1 Tax=Nephila pilipes TaxID=299642 RepID=A0A8X6PTD2_NEPPI|nr:hypothetical protein NPIL_246351 [Nephila pilipes]